MAVAYGSSTNLASGTGTRSWSSPNTASCAGAVVVCTGGAVDETSDVTYGGVSMTRIATGRNTAGESGTTSCWFLNNPADGVQTVEVVRSGSTAYIATVYTLTSATGETEVVPGGINVGYDEGNSTSISTISTSLVIPSGVVCWLGGGLYSGENALSSITDDASLTRSHSVDFGNFVAVINRRTSLYTGTGAALTTFGWTQSSDDGAWAVVAIREFTPSFDKSGSFSVAHASSVAVQGRKGGAGISSVSHTSSTADTANKGGRGSWTVSHASATSALGGGSSSLAITHVSSTSVQGRKGRTGSLSVSHVSATAAAGRKGGQGSVSVSHASATAATGTKPTFDFSGSFAITHVSATSVQGATGRRGSASVAHSSATAAQGRSGRAGTVSVPHSSATSVLGRHDGAGILSVSLASTVSVQDTTGRRGSFTVSQASSTSATGTAAQAAAGSWSLALTSSVSVQGRKDAASVLGISLGSAVAVLGASSRSGILGISLESLTQAQGVHDGFGAVVLGMASSTAATGQRVAQVLRPGITISDGPTATATIRDQGRFGGSASDRERMTVGVNDG